MRITVRADDGDEISIRADVVSVEQALVSLEIDNGLYDYQGELETVSLTIGQARELAMALLSVADAIDFVRTPAAALKTRSSDADVEIDKNTRRSVRPSRLPWRPNV